MSDDLAFFLPDFAPCNDAFGPAETLVRAVNGLTILEALSVFAGAEVALCSGASGPWDAPRMDSVMAHLRPMEKGWALEALRRARILILGGHHVNVHAGKMSWELDRARARRTPHGEGRP